MAYINTFAIVAALPKGVEWLVVGGVLLILASLPKKKVLEIMEEALE